MSPLDQRLLASAERIANREPEDELDRNILQRRLKASEDGRVCGVAPQDDEEEPEDEEEELSGDQMDRIDERQYRFNGRGEE